MSSFFQNAAGILDCAAQAGRDGLGQDEASPDVAILVDASGALLIVDGAGWTPEGLQAHYGARTVYQVLRDSRKVSVRARSGAQTCTLETSIAGLTPFAAPYTVLPHAVPSTVPCPIAISGLCS